MGWLRDWLAYNLRYSLGFFGKRKDTKEGSVQLEATEFDSVIQADKLAIDKLFSYLNAVFKLPNYGT